MLDGTVLGLRPSITTTFYRENAANASCPTLYHLTSEAFGRTSPGSIWPHESTGRMSRRCNTRACQLPPRRRQCQQVRRDGPST